MADDDLEPTDELDAEGGGRAPAGLADPPLIGPGRWLGGRYVLDHRIGHGGMAVVWLAIDNRLRRPVAVKVLSDTLTADHDYLGRFRREAQVAARLQHPNLVSIYDYDAGERPYLVMEYIEGGDLAAAMDAGTPPPPDRLAEELLSALRHIHAAGILHRDIKPQNVLLDGYRHARLSDFGIARPRDATSLTRTGEVIGTERYLAPELMAGEPATERSDLFALGVLLAGLDGGGPVAPLAERLRDPDPARRPASAAAALAELERADSVRPPGPPTRPYSIEPEPTGPRPFEPTLAGSGAHRRRNRLLALGAVAVTAIAAIALALSGGGDEGGDGRRTAAESRGADQSSGGDPAGGGDSSPAPAPEPAPEPEPAEPTTTAEEPAGGSDDGFALNDQGFALVGQGRYEEAIPVLERAVDALGGSGDEATYNYALYNLATAYLGADRPADAIPLLEERMSFDDGQLAEVQLTLDEAYKAAGAKPPKPGKGPKNGHVPPPFEEDGD